MNKLIFLFSLTCLFGCRHSSISSSKSIDGSISLSSCIAVKSEGSLTTWETDDTVYFQQGNVNFSNVTKFNWIQATEEDLRKASVTFPNFMIVLDGTIEQSNSTKTQSNLKSKYPGKTIKSVFDNELQSVSFNSDFDHAVGGYTLEGNRIAVMYKTGSAQVFENAMIELKYKDPCEGNSVQVITRISTKDDGKFNVINKTAPLYSSNFGVEDLNKINNLVESFGLLEYLKTAGNARINPVIADNYFSMLRIMVKYIDSDFFKTYCSDSRNLCSKNEIIDSNLSLFDYRVKKIKDSGILNIAWQQNQTTQINRFSSMVIDSLFLYELTLEGKRDVSKYLSLIPLTAFFKGQKEFEDKLFIFTPDAIRVRTQDPNAQLNQPLDYGQNFSAEVTSAIENFGADTIGSEVFKPSNQEDSVFISRKIKNRRIVPSILDFLKENL